MGLLINVTLTVGEAIRIFRKRRKMTQAELAEKSGYSRSYINMIELDKVSEEHMPLSTLIEIFGVFGIQLNVSIRQKEDVKPDDDPA